MPEGKDLEVAIIAKPESPDAVRLVLKGRLTWTTADQFSTRLLKLCDEGILHVEADLGEVTYIDTSGLEAFITAQKTISGINGSLKITNVTPLIRQRFTTTHLDQVLSLGP